MSTFFLVLAIIVLVLMFVLGAPVWSALMSCAIILLIGHLNIPTQMVPINVFGKLDSFTLMACPFFMLAGNIMAYGGSAPYLFNVMNSWLGNKRGGIPIAVVCTCAIYAAITGATSATLAGVSNIALPVMDKAGYSRKFSGGLMACSATLGQLIPPSVIMIVYGTITQTDVSKLFLAGFIPGIICAAALAVVAFIRSPRPEMLTTLDPENFTWKTRKITTIKGIPALIMPVIVLGGIYSGIVTPTEAGALSCVYGLVISAFVYRKMNMKNLAQTTGDSVRALSMTFMVSSASLVFAIPITYMQIPQKVAQWVTAQNLTGTSLVLLIVVIYLIMGCFLDPLPIMYLMLPIVLPTLQSAGINLIYFNIVTVIAMQIGQVTPPFGISLYMASKFIGVEITDVAKESMPYLLGMVAVLLLIIFVPQLSLMLIH